MISRKEWFWILTAAVAVGNLFGWLLKMAVITLWVALFSGSMGKALGG